MKILVLNSGSSSLKYKLFEMPARKQLIKGHVDGIGLPTCIYIVNDDIRNVFVENHHKAVEVCLETLKSICDLSDIQAVGHWVVHGGEYFTKAAFIDEYTIGKIEELKDLAPLHNPPNLEGIYACKKLLPNVKQVAVFDTAFHHTIPKKAFLYGIPYEYYEKYKIRKYGFHGTSHKYVANRANEILKKNLRSITCHLGNGASITAVKDIKSMDTTMGFTPLQGLMMGTRSGDIDAEIVAFLMEKTHADARKVIWNLNHISGLKGICGYSDVRTIHEKAMNGDEMARLALDMFVYRIVHYIGAYDAILEGADAIVFTAGIGENADFIREVVCEKLKFIGVEIDKGKNKRHETIISTSKSDIKVMVIPTNEEEQIAYECMEFV